MVTKTNVKELRHDPINETYDTIISSPSYECGVYLDLSMALLFK